MEYYINRVFYNPRIFRISYIGGVPRVECYVNKVWASDTVWKISDIRNPHYGFESIDESDVFLELL